MFSLFRRKATNPMDKLDTQPVEPLPITAARVVADLDSVLAEVPYEDGEPPIGNQHPTEGDNPFAPDTMDPLNASKAIDDLLGDDDGDNPVAFHQTAARTTTAEMNLVDPQESYGTGYADPSESLSNQGFQARHPRSLAGPAHPHGSKNTKAHGTPVDDHRDFEIAEPVTNWDGTNFEPVEEDYQRDYVASSEDAPNRLDEPPVGSGFVEEPTLASVADMTPDAIPSPGASEPTQSPIANEAAGFDPNEMNELFGLASFQAASDDDLEASHTAADLSVLSGKVIVLTGKPPAPLQKKHVADMLLSQYHAAACEPIFTKRTQVVIYEPREVDTAKLAKAKAAGLLVLPYEAVTIAP